MKKTIITVAILIVGITTATANPFSGTKPEFKAKKDSTEIVESGFKTNYLADEHKLQVEITGNTDPFASVSIADNRGGSILFSIVGECSQEIEFDLSKLEKGIYNVMFITNQEIRIKKIELK